MYAQRQKIGNPKNYLKQFRAGIPKGLNRIGKNQLWSSIPEGKEL
jgi:hypothetical protein